MAFYGLFVDIFGLAFVGLEDNVWFCATDGVFKRRVLFVFKVMRKIFATGDDADKLIAGLWSRRDVVGKGVGNSAVPYNDGTKSATMFEKKMVSDSAVDSAV